MLTEKEHAELSEVMGFDKDYVHPAHRQEPPVVYFAGASQPGGQAKEPTMDTTKNANNQ